MTKTPRKAAKAIAKAEPSEMSASTRKASQRAVQRVVERVAAGEERVMMGIRHTDPKSTVREPLHGMREQELDIRLMDAFGTTSLEFVDAMIVNLLTVADAPTDRRATREMNAALAVLDGLKPENEIEAMLATQMVAANDAAMRCLAQIKTPMHAETYGNLAVKLMRTFTAQAEALAKLRRKGEQVVRVVHVHPGGQAVVGDVHHHPIDGGRGQPTENGGQSDATGDFGQGAALPSPNPSGQGVPIPRRRRPKAVPNARRDEPRSAGREPKCA